jgi:hypothetical protein
MKEFKKYLQELKHNRDHYTRAKIIELIGEKYDELSDGWVSVEDRLPKGKKGFLAYYKHFGNDMIYTCVLHEGKIYDDMIDVTADVTHWMPLPTLPNPSPKT